VPYVIGAKWAHCPIAPAIALVGDGAMQMNGLAEYDHGDEVLDAIGGMVGSSSPCCTINDLNQVTWKVRAMERLAKVRRIPDAARCRLRRIRA
jgi:hypothetical protein